MKKFATLAVLAFALALWAPSASATNSYNCTGWNFNFSGPGGGVGPDPGSCVLESGGNYSSINPLLGTIGTNTVDPEEDGEEIQLTFNTATNSLDINDNIDPSDIAEGGGDFDLTSTITSWSVAGNVITMNFTVTGSSNGPSYAPDTGTANVTLAPEPASMMLLASGLLGMAATRRRFTR